MKIFVRVIQVLVGVLFIISGLVKANDPLGLSYKMQEFFELWNSSLKAGHFFAANMLIGFFDFLHAHALALSVFMITLEIVTGVALLVGWMKRFILYLLLVLIIFFTFLTGYAYLSGKFTNCGCFGDCLPITPFTSFVKDLVLLAMIIFLIIGARYIQPVASPRFRATVLSLSLLLSILLQWYVLNYLPLADCLPFKKGNNIAEQMRPPKGAITDSIAIRFIYEKDGKQYEFAPENLPADFETYTYKDRIDKLVRKGNAEPRIKGLSFTDTSGTDATQTVLSQSLAIVVFALDADSGAWINDLKKLQAEQKNIPAYFVTSNPQRFDALLRRHQVSIPVFACDFTVIRTAARTDPTLYILQSGNIHSKYGVHDFDKARNVLKNL